MSQQGHPIAYFSKKLVSRTQRQSAYTREFYAITEALAKFCHYLLGHKFVIRTDQKSLKSLLDQSLQTPEQQAWLHKFIGFDFTIKYKPGKDNQAADTLSRVLYFAWSEPRHHLLDHLREELATHSELSTIIQQCIKGDCVDPLYIVKGGLLFRNSRLVVPSPSSLIKIILLEYHSSPIGGHAGIARTLARITS